MSVLLGRKTNQHRIVHAIFSYHYVLRNLWIYPTVLGDAHHIRVWPQGH